jgi:hypothetical protein
VQVEAERTEVQPELDTLSKKKQKKKEKERKKKEKESRAAEESKQSETIQELEESVLNLDYVVRPKNLVRYLERVSFKQPQGLTVDPRSHAVFIADSKLHCVKGFSSEGRSLSQFGARLRGADRPTAGHFVMPLDVIATAGKLYILDPVSVQVFTIGGEHLYTFGTAHTSPSGYFESAKCFAIDEDGDVFVLDSRSGKIHVFSADGTFQMHIGEGLNLDLKNASFMTAGDNKIYVWESEVRKIFVLERTGAYITSWKLSSFVPPKVEITDLTGMSLFGKWLYLTAAKECVVMVISAESGKLDFHWSWNRKVEVKTGSVRNASLAVDPKNKLMYLSDTNEKTVRVYSTY